MVERNSLLELAEEAERGVLSGDLASAEASAAFFARRPLEEFVSLLVPSSADENAVDCGERWDGAIRGATPLLSSSERPRAATFATACPKLNRYRDGAPPPYFLSSQCCAPWTLRCRHSHLTCC